MTSQELRLIYVGSNIELRIISLLVRAKEIAQEIAFVDTGSTDRTIEFAKEFVEKFEAAQTFNVDAKAGKGKDDLTWADAIEDIEEAAEDDIDTNKTADQDGE